MMKTNSKYAINGVEVIEENYRMYEFLTRDSEDVKMLFHIMLDEFRIIGKTIVRFKKFIRENRNIDFDEIINVCKNKDVMDCKDTLEKLFLEPINIAEVAARMNRQGWSLTNLILHHREHPEKRIHRILNIPYSIYIEV